MVTEQYGLPYSDHSTVDCGSSSMVLDRRIDGDLCGSSYPDRDYGRGSRSRQVGDCCLVTSELEEDVTMDEVLSDICSITADGDYVSGYLRFSLKGAP